MPLSYIWELKEMLSEKFWGKSADEINDMVKPNVEEMTRRIDEIRQKKNVQ